MALYALHYALSAAGSLPNAHLLLDESLGLIWDWRIIVGGEGNHYSSEAKLLPNHTPECSPDFKQQFRRATRSNHQNELQDAAATRPLVVHLALFVIMLSAFVLGAFSSTCQADVRRDHRRRLLKALAALVGLQAAHLYIINALVAGAPSAGPLRLVHSALQVLLLLGVQWALLVIGTIGDTLTLNSCLKRHKPIGSHYQFVTNLMVHALSLAFACVSLYELFGTFASHHYYQYFYRSLNGARNNASSKTLSAHDQLTMIAASNPICFTNASLIVCQIAFLVELVLLYQFTCERAANQSSSTSSPSNTAAASNKETNANKSAPKQSLFAQRWTEQVIGSKTLFSFDESAASLTVRSMYSVDKRPKRLRTNTLGSWPVINSSTTTMTATSEVVRATDDEEFDNSGLFYICSGLHSSQTQPSKLSTHKANAGRELFFDRAKYSLYDETTSPDTTTQAPPLNATVETTTPAPASGNNYYGSFGFKRPPSSSVSSSPQTPNPRAPFEPLSSYQTHLAYTERQPMGTLEILIGLDWSFLRHAGFVALVGAVVQGNQYFLLVNQVRKLIYHSSIDFRSQLFATLWPLISASKLQHLSLIHLDDTNVASQHALYTLWVELICIGLLFHSSSRLMSLHYSSYLVRKLGYNQALAGLSCLALGVLLQFYLSEALFMGQPQPSSDSTSAWALPSNARVAVVLGLLPLIQAQVGFLAAMLDFLINDLTLQHGQQVAAFRDASLADFGASQPTHCTINGVLRGSSQLVGGSLATAISLLAHGCFGFEGGHNWSWTSRTMSLLPLLSLVGVAIWLLNKRHQSARAIQAANQATVT